MESEPASARCKFSVGVSNDISGFLGDTLVYLGKRPAVCGGALP